MKEFTREELQGIRERSTARTEEAVTNPCWKRAYMRLADAADAIDAMIARTIDAD